MKVTQFTSFAVRMVGENSHMFSRFPKITVSVWLRSKSFHSAVPVIYTPAEAGRAAAHIRKKYRTYFPPNHPKRYIANWFRP